MTSHEYKFQTQHSVPVTYFFTAYLLTSKLYAVDYSVRPQYCKYVGEDCCSCNREGYKCCNCTEG